MGSIKYNSAVSITTFTAPDLYFIDHIYFYFLTIFFNPEVIFIIWNVYLYSGLLPWGNLSAKLDSTCFIIL